MLVRCMLIVGLLAISPLARAADDAKPEAGLKALGGKFVATGFKASFSPDGKQLAFGNFPPNAGVQILDLTSGRATEISGLGKDPTWSPDGKWIAHVRGNGDTEEVWLMRPDGSSARKLGIGGPPTWSDDGKRVMCHSHTTGKLIALKISEETPMAEALADVTATWYPAVTADGKRTAFPTGDGKFKVFDREKMKATAVWPIAGWNGCLPTFSPDGKQVALGSYGHDNKVGLWVINVENNEVRKVCDGPITMAAWSADGAKMVVDLRAGQRSEIWVLDAKKIADIKPEKDKAAAE